MPSRARLPAELKGTKAQGIRVLTSVSLCFGKQSSATTRTLARRVPTTDTNARCMQSAGTTLPASAAAAWLATRAMAGSVLQKVNCWFVFHLWELGDWVTGALNFWITLETSAGLPKGCGSRVFQLPCFSVFPLPRL